MLFSPEQLGQWLQQHPIYQVAALQERETRMNRLRNKGQFDPKVEFGLDKKEIRWQGVLRFAEIRSKGVTWPGIDLQAALKENSGIYLDPQNTLPTVAYWNWVQMPNCCGVFFMTSGEQPWSKAEYSRWPMRPTDGRCSMS